MPTNRDKQDLRGREVRTLKGIIRDSEGFVSVPLPSRRGTVMVKGMKGHETNLFTMDNRLEPVKPFKEILKRLVQGDQKSGVHHFKRLLIADFLFLIYVIRRNTYGDMFTFGVVCPHCKGEFDWEEDLSTTEIFYASDEDTKVLCRPDEECHFETVLPSSGYPCKYRLPVFFHQEKLIEVYKNKKQYLTTESLRLCVKEIVSPTADVHLHDRLFADLPELDLKVLDQTISSHDIGVNTSLNVTCPHCLTMGEYQLPLRDTDFLQAPRNLKPKADGTWSTFWAAPPGNSSGKKSSS